MYPACRVRIGSRRNPRPDFLTVVPMTAIMPIDGPRPRGTVLGERTDGQRVSEAEHFFDARRAAIISTRAISRGPRITQAGCRIPRKMEFDNHNGNRLATRAESQVKVISRGGLF